jgi:lipopolysaccharide export system protein LptA
VRLLLCALVLAQAQDPKPIENYKGSFSEENPKSGRKEIVADVEAAQAVPVETTPRQIFDVRQVKVLYYTEPGTDGKSETIVLNARGGRWDSTTGLLELNDQVRVDRPNSTLEAAAASLDLRKKTIRLRQRVKIVSQDAAGKRVATALADEADIVSPARSEAKTPGTPRSTTARAPRPERLVARGRVLLEHADGARVEAEILEWESKGDYDFAKLEGKPRVTVQHGRNRVRAKTVEIERLRGLSTFREEVEADLARGDSEPLHLECRTLIARSAPSDPRALDEVEALENVVLRGLMARKGEEPGRAEADRFLWSETAQRGVLEARRFVRVTQGGSTILAPALALSGKSTVVLKGPKIVRRVQVRDGKEERLSATCEGDLVYDADLGTITLRDRCLIRTGGVELRADAVRIRLAAEGRGAASLRAWGRVRARQAAEGTALFGDRLDYDPSHGTLRVTGFPASVAEGTGWSARQRTLEIDEATGRVRMLGASVGGDGMDLRIAPPRK